MKRKTIGIILFEALLLIMMKVLIFVHAILKRYATKRSTKCVKGKVVLITGTARGLGRQLALNFSKHGCTLLCVDFNKDGNQETLGMLNDSKHRAYTCDVSDYDAVVQLQKDILNEFKHVDILVNNASIVCLLSNEDEAPDITRKIVEVNLLSHMWMTKVFLPDMIDRNSGHIVAICSVLGIFASEKAITYSSTKHGVLGFMSSLSVELAAGRKDIKTTIVCPHLIETELVKKHTVVKSRIPLLNLERTAKDIVRGILEERYMIFLPDWMWILTTGINYLPPFVRLLILNFFIQKYEPNDLPEWKEAYKIK